MGHPIGWVGIDNGVTGTIGFVSSMGHVQMWHTPTKTSLNYQKKGQIVQRVDVKAMRQIFRLILSKLDIGEKAGVVELRAIVERPFTMASASKAVLSGQRAMEATLIALEIEGIPYEFIDSKQWQKPMLGTELKGSPVLKRASLAKGKQLWPLFDWIPFKQDADGLLIAEWAKTRVPF
jgi:hypothetical protein